MLTTAVGAVTCTSLLLENCPEECVSNPPLDGGNGLGCFVDAIGVRGGTLSKLVFSFADEFVVATACTKAVLDKDREPGVK